jgi:Tol biopolymer transport system component
MKTLGGRMRKRIVAIGMLLLSAAALAAMQNGNDLYQQGLARETAGDIKGAIQIFERIVRDFSSNRALTARALLQLGQSSDLLGQDQSRKYYERVIREFADQTEAAAEARKRLTALDSGRPATVSARRINVPAHPTSSITRDGRLMAIVAERGNVAIYDMSTGQTRRLTDVANPWRQAYAEPPVLLSPDLRQVTYLWFDIARLRYQLRVMPNQPGAPQHVLVDNPEFKYLQAMAWSPDGKSILTVMWKPDGTSQLAWVSVADDAVRLLKSFGWRHVDRPSLSSDGRYIAYSATPGAESVNSSIYILAADGSSETEVVQGTNINEAPAWSPDGGRVFFTSNRSGGFGLWSIAVRNGKALGSPELIKPDIGRIAVMGFTSSGTYYYMHLTESNDIYVAELDPASSKARGPAVPITESFTGSRWPAWSPDGKSLAFTRQRGGVNTGNDLVVRSLETGQERKYVGADANLQPMWFPDGKNLLVPVKQQGRVVLQHVNLETGEFGKVWEKGEAAALAPDGKTLYVATEGIQAIDLATGRERQLFASPQVTDISGLAVSPDGETLAFTESRQRIGLVGADGAGFRELYTSNGGDANYGVGAPVWTRDGRAILFVEGTNQGGKLMRLSVAGGEPEFTGLENVRNLFSLSADGKRLAFPRRAADGPEIVEVWALDDLLAKPAK